MSNTIIQYIASGSEIVLQRNGVNQWYTTKQDATVSSYTTAPCPMRNSLPVLSGKVMGFQVWFLENQLSVRMPENKVTSVPLVSLEYDVPAAVSTNPSRYRDENGVIFRHPSQWMWGIGIRTTLSCWILPASSIPYRRLKGLTRAGCQWRVTRIDASDAENHIQRAIIALRRELSQVDERYADNMSAAQTRYQERENSRESTSRLESDMERNKKTLEASIKNVESGAFALSIPMSWIRSEGSVKMGVSTNRASQQRVMENRVNAHCAVVDSLTAAGHTAVASAIEAGTMPHDIAADYCEDKEVKVEDGDGDYSLRDVFSNE